MKWTGDITGDGMLAVDCARCNGTGTDPVAFGPFGSRDFCVDCGGLGLDYFDPLPVVRAPGMAAALTLAFGLGHDAARAPFRWRPNIDGRAVEVTR